jgi:hypothetical protein
MPRSVPRRGPMPEVSTAAWASRAYSFCPVALYAVYLHCHTTTLIIRAIVSTVACDAGETSTCCSLLAVGQQPLPLDRLLKSYESVLLHHSVVPEQDFHYYRVLLKLFLDPNPDWWAKLYNERMSNRCVIMPAHHHTSTHPAAHPHRCTHLHQAKHSCASAPWTPGLLSHASTVCCRPAGQARSPFSPTHRTSAGFSSPPTQQRRSVSAESSATGNGIWDNLNFSTEQARASSRSPQGSRKVSFVTDPLQNVPHVPLSAREQTWTGSEQQQQQHSGMDLVRGALGAQLRSSSGAAPASSPSSSIEFVQGVLGASLRAARSSTTPAASDGQQQQQQQQQHSALRSAATSMSGAPEGLRPGGQQRSLRSRSTSPMPSRLASSSEAHQQAQPPHVDDIEAAWLAEDLRNLSMQRRQQQEQRQQQQGMQPGQAAGSRPRSASPIPREVLQGPMHFFNSGYSQPTPEPGQQQAHLQQGGQYPEQHQQQQVLYSHPTLSPQVHPYSLPLAAAPAAPAAPSPPAWGIPLVQPWHTAAAATSPRLPPMCHSPTDSVSVSTQTASQQRSQQLQTQGSLVSAGTCNTEQQEQCSDLQQAFKTWRMHARIHKHYRCAAMLPCRHAAMPPCRHAAMPPCCHAAMLPCRHAAMLPCCHAAMLPLKQG